MDNWKCLVFIYDYKCIVCLSLQSRRKLCCAKLLINFWLILINFWSTYLHQISINLHQNWFLYRGDGNDVVPNFDWICPKEKEAKPDVIFTFNFGNLLDFFYRKILVVEIEVGLLWILWMFWMFWLFREDFGIFAQFYRIFAKN